MALSSPVPDHTLQRNVERKLTQKCSGTNKIRVKVSNGEVTVEGALRFEYERKPIIRVVNAVSGIRRVVDLMSVVVKSTKKDVVNWRKVQAAELKEAEKEKDAEKPNKP